MAFLDPSRPNICKCYVCLCLESSQRLPHGPRGNSNEGIETYEVLIQLNLMMVAPHPRHRCRRTRDIHIKPRFRQRRLARLRIQVWHPIYILLVCTGIVINASMCWDWSCCCSGIVCHLAVFLREIGGGSEVVSIQLVSRRETWRELMIN